MNRDLMPAILIVSACCLAAWLVAVNPLVERANALEEEVDELESILANGHEDIDTLQAQSDRLEQRFDEIRRRSAFAHDTSTIYTALKRLTHRHRLAIQGIDVEVQGGGQAAELDLSNDEMPLRQRETTFAVAVRGTYRDLGGFLAAIDELDAFVRVDSLSIRPAARSERGVEVYAKMQLQALGFATPAPLHNWARDDQQGDARRVSQTAIPPTAPTTAPATAPPTGRPADDEGATP